MQTVLKKGPLLDEKGHLIESGYAKTLTKTYDRKDITVKGFRIKEWDYYYIGNEFNAVSLTVADNHYMYFASVTLFDFTLKKEETKAFMGFFPLKRLGMPSSSKYGDVCFKKKSFSFEFKHENNQRHLLVDIKDFNHKPFKLDVFLTAHDETNLVIATPFKKKGHFYYNHKINLMDANGFYQLGDQVSHLNNAFGTLDWGRGVWTYQNTWYWASLSTVSDGKKLGFNLGYGFGDTSKASENMFYYDQASYKLEDVQFNIPSNHGKDDFMSNWTFTSKNNAINLVFEPILDRKSNTNVLLIKSDQHQVFGYFSGKITLDDGKKIEIDHKLGFAEKVFNRW